MITSSNSRRSCKADGRSPIRVGILSLGCPKTLVDSEVVLGRLAASRCRIVPSVTDCDVALLNTCSFIREAQEESIERLLELVALKKERKIKALVVMGCLVQRFPKELQQELREDVDAFVGSGEYARIAEIVQRVDSGQKVFSVGRAGYLATSAEGRVALTPPHYRYIKLSEGCDHVCTFCTIPSFRGKHRSRSIEDVVCEARQLVAEGAKEIILTGQDTTSFGRDRSGRYELAELLYALNRLPGIHWIRVLYAYPSCLTQEMIDAIRDCEKVCAYLDMPLQHASDRILTRMRRGITKRRTIDLIERLRKTVPGIALRTTFITGFPGETESDFQELLEFMEAMKFERVGIFTYSKEEGTPAAIMPDQVPEHVKEERLHEAMLLQQDISRRNNERMLGKTVEVLIEERDEQNPDFWIGRCWMDAPEVDGNVWVRAPEGLRTGEFYPVKITSVREYDLVGEYPPPSA